MNLNGKTNALRSFSEQLLTELDALYRKAYYMVGDPLLAENVEIHP